MLGTIWTMLKETVTFWFDDNCLSRGAAIAYFTVFSIAPMLVICIAIAGLVFGDEAAQGAVVGQLQGLMGQQGAEAIQTMIASASNKESGIWATVVGVVLLLVTASGVFGEVQTSLNAIWKAEPKGGISTILKARAASLGLVATLGFLLIVSLVVSAVLTALGDYLSSFLPGASMLMQVVNFVVSFTIVSALFAAIYKILPDRQLAYRDVAVGAVATAFLFTVGKTLIGLYLGSGSVASSYGAAGALVIVLLWVYYSSQIFLLGAEFTKVWASHNGSAAAFAAQSADGGATKPGPQTPVENVIAHSAARKAPIGLFDIAALGTLMLVAFRGYRGR